MEHLKSYLNMLKEQSNQTNKGQCPFPDNKKYTCQRQGPPIGDPPIVLPEICATCKNPVAYPSNLEFRKPQTFPNPTTVIRPITGRKKWHRPEKQLLKA